MMERKLQMRIVRNCYGDRINELDRELEDPSYGKETFDKYGFPEIDWDFYIIGNHDIHGFDKDVKYNKEYWYVTIELPYGTRLLRYGNESGHYTAPIETRYEDLSLPYKKETLEYNEYKVLADGLKVRCLVKMGKVAASRNSRGGAIQYFHSNKIIHLVGWGVLERIDWWKGKKY